MFYVEVHHIIPLAEELNTSTEYVQERIEGIPEDECLDTLDNMIVVCPNHHRYLHYQHGGGFVVFRKNNKLYLRNQKDDELQIYMNYHL